MNHPGCHSTDSFVRDSRMASGTIWRRRVCSSCGVAFTTYEVGRDEYLRLTAAERTLAKAAAVAKTLARKLGIEC